MRLPSFKPLRLALPLAVALGLAAADARAGIEENVLQPTPLVLKDGRIAYVVVHTIPFEAGTAQVSPENMQILERVLRPIATDCFLTAQAIGHVRPGKGGDGDTLEAHRLARARADEVQKLLVGLGLPASAIASVWDWQFLVRESRVTLWIFRLNQGEDCKGTPIGGAARVASAETETGPAPQTRSQPQSQAAVEALQAKPPASIAAPAVSAVPLPPAPDPAPTNAGSQVGRAAETFAKLDAGGDAPAGEPAPATEPKAAPAPTPAPVAAATTARLEAPEEPPAPAPVPAATEAPATAALGNAPDGTPDEAEGGTEIVFPVNSSYLPGDAATTMRAFLEGLGGPSVLAW